MSQVLDVYRDWLGIQETARPLNHYQILRLKRFEDNTAKVREHYRKLSGHVRAKTTGPSGQQAVALLEELAKAVLCLTDTRSKQEYDQSLGRPPAGEGPRRTFEEILLSQDSVMREQLDAAAKFSHAVGLEMRDALIQQKAARADVIMAAYAESLGLPYLDVADLPIDGTLVRQVPALLARQHSVVPVMVDRNQVLMVSPSLISPEVEDELRLRLGMPVRVVLCTSAGVNELINKHYSREAAAAEMAGGGPAPSTATGAKSAKASKKPKLDPNSPEGMKYRRDVTIASFCFTNMVYFFTLTALFGFDWSGWSWTLWLATIFGGVLLASIAAGVAWTKAK